MENKTIVSLILTVLIIILIIIGWNVNRSKFSSDEPPTATATSTDSSASTSPSQVTNNQNKKMTNNIVTLETSLGQIKIETYNQDAPNTVANFVKLAQKGYYDGLIFHRVISGFMIQGGDPTGTGTGGPGYQFADELNPATASYKEGYKRGIVAMANAGPNTNGSQFFIMHQDYGLPNNYTIFGHVIEGLDVVDRIASVKTDTGDRPLEAVIIKTATVE